MNDNSNDNSIDYLLQMIANMFYNSGLTKDKINIIYSNKGFQIPYPETQNNKKQSFVDFSDISNRKAINKELITLKKLINDALDKNDKEKFIEYTNQFKNLKEKLRNS